MTQSPEVNSLIELLIEADPDSLLDAHADLLTPDQLWRATGESMRDMIKYAGGRKEFLDFAVEKDSYEFLEEFEGEWDPALLARMVEEYPGDCLDNILDKLSPEQKRKCIEADLVTAAGRVKDELTDEQVRRLVKEHPETALECLTDRLDDETFQSLALKFPNTAWYTAPHRLNLKFIEKYLLDPIDPMEQLTKARKLSAEQVKMVLAAHPELVWNETRKTFDDAPKGQPCPGHPEKAGRKWLVWAAGLTGIGIGIAIGIALAVPQ